LQIVAAETVVIQDIASHEYKVSLPGLRQRGDGAHCLKPDETQLGSPFGLQVTQLQTELPIRRMNESDHETPQRHTPSRSLTQACKMRPHSRCGLLLVDLPGCR
jgi:hypothetical protein